MKLPTTVFLFILSISICFSAFSQSSYQAPLAAESLLLDIVKTSNEYVAVGERGHILTSKEADAWTQVSVPTTATLTAITSHENQLWAVGHDATILHRDAQNDVWTIQYQNPDLEKPLLDVLFLTPSEGIAVGAYGMFLRTVDGGNTWTNELHPSLLNPDDIEYLEEIRLEDEAFYQSELLSILPHLNSVTMIDDWLYLVGETGLVAKSENFGKSWERIPLDYYGSLFTVTHNAERLPLVAGLRGNIFTMDQQQQWSKIKSGITASINTLVPDETGFIAMGNSGYVVCNANNTHEVVRRDNGKSITSAILDNRILVFTTGEGVNTLNLSDGSNACKEVGEQQ